LGSPGSNGSQSTTSSAFARSSRLVLLDFFYDAAPHFQQYRLPKQFCGAVYTASYVFAVFDLRWLLD
jgi:hypothetical protein